jgi:hypothetical protein
MDILSIILIALVPIALLCLFVRPGRITTGEAEPYDGDYEEMRAYLWDLWAAARNAGDWDEAAELSDEYSRLVQDHGVRREAR